MCVLGEAVERETAEELWGGSWDRGLHCHVVAVEKVNEEIIHSSLQYRNQKVSLMQ